MKISVVIPAYNEEKFIAAALESIASSTANVGLVEIIVADNVSTDQTREIAGAAGATVVTETIHNISRVRNRGAEIAGGDILLFLDADTCVQPGLFEQIATCFAESKCIGGAVDVNYTPANRKWIKYYLLGWQFWGRFLKMRQGAAQFCRRSAFDAVGGYDETIYVGEDIEFHWRLARLARSSGGTVAFIEKPPVLTSPRRFDKMGIVRTLVITHPITIFLGWRIRRFWKDWYEDLVR